MNDDLKAPFIWFGGKRKVAHHVWAGLGNVSNYVEPFAGSLAVLLERPKSHGTQTETVNDADSFICNFWRSLSKAPDQVAFYADYPVCETDLFARHLWLVNEGKNRIAKLESDPDYYDAKVAGWWVWGINSWIGSGWCTGTGPWVYGEEPTDRPHPKEREGKQGIKKQLPHLGNSGRGINRKSSSLYSYMEQLANRLRNVRVVNGDWSRVVTKGAINFGDTVGIFLDPPYSGDVRTSNLYAYDDHKISNLVGDWCVEHGQDKRLRIVLAGYEDEHESRIPPTWRRIKYSAGLAYSNSSGKGQNTENRHKEVLWFSPGCINSMPTIFD